MRTSDSRREMRTKSLPFLISSTSVHPHTSGVTQGHPNQLSLNTTVNYTRHLLFVILCDREIKILTPTQQILVLCKKWVTRCQTTISTFWLNKFLEFLNVYKFQNTEYRNHFITNWLFLFIEALCSGRLDAPPTLVENRHTTRYSLTTVVVRHSIPKSVYDLYTVDNPTLPVASRPSDPNHPSRDSFTRRKVVN